MKSNICEAKKSNFQTQRLVTILLIQIEKSVLNLRHPCYIDLFAQ